MTSELLFRAFSISFIKYVYFALKQHLSEYKISEVRDLSFKNFKKFNLEFTSHKIISCFFLCHLRNTTLSKAVKCCWCDKNNWEPLNYVGEWNLEIGALKRLKDYRRSICSSCFSSEKSIGIVVSLLNPRLMSARVSFNSIILQEMREYFWLSTVKCSVNLHNASNEMEWPWLCYLGGTAVSWFLLKFTLATGLSSTASNTSSGMDPSCFSLRKKMANLHC